MPRTRAGFEGYRLLREYFMMPERFHFARVDGLRPVAGARPRRSSRSSSCCAGRRRSSPTCGRRTWRSSRRRSINLFERDCNLVELDPRRPRQVLHADRTRPRDFEIYRVTALEDADREGPEARLPALFGFGQNAAPRPVLVGRAAAAAAGEDERRHGQMRTSLRRRRRLPLAVSWPEGASRAGSRRVAARALCTNRDLPMLDDQPTLTLESGDPVEAVTLLGRAAPAAAVAAGRAADRAAGREPRRRAGLAAGRRSCR